MAILIDLFKEDEDDSGVVYRFGADELWGRLLLQKADGAMIELEPVPGHNPQFFFSRAGVAIRKHWERGEYPEHTCYAR